MNNFELIDGEDDKGKCWSLGNEITGEFVYVGYEFVPPNSDVRYKIVGGEPPSINCKMGTMYAKRTGVDEQIAFGRTISLNPEYFDFKWKRL